MQLVFIHGPAAAGKLTVARELSALTGLPLFHNHLVVDIVARFYEFGTKPFIELREELWRDVFRKAASTASSFIFTFNPEATVRERFIDDVLKIVEADHGGTVRFVEITCSEDEIERRMDSPSRQEFGKLRSLSLYRELRETGAFEYRPMPASFLRIDTSQLSANEVAQQIADALVRSS